MPIQWVNNTDVDKKIIKKLEFINKLKFTESTENIGSNFYQNDHTDVNFPPFSLVNCSELGYKPASTFPRTLRPEFYQPSSSLPPPYNFSSFLMIRECSYKLQSKLGLYNLNKQYKMYQN